MSRLRTPAFSLMNSCWMNPANRFHACAIINKRCLIDVDQEKNEDIKTDEDSLITPEELENKQQRRDRYKPSE